MRLLPSLPALPEKRAAQNTNQKRGSVLGFSVLVEGLELAAVLRRMLAGLRRTLAGLCRTLAGLDVDGVNVGPTGLFQGQMADPGLFSPTPRTSSAGHLPAAMVKLAVVTCASPRLGTMWERMVLPSKSEMVGFLFSGSNLPSKSKSFSDPKPRDAP